MLDLTVCGGGQAPMSSSKRRPIHPCDCSSCRQHPYSQTAQQHKAINRVLATLNEKNRRHFVGVLAIQLGAQRIALLARITGLSRPTIYRGKREVEHPNAQVRERVRAPGAGRRAVEKNNPAFWRTWTACSKMPRRVIRLPV